MEINDDPYALSHLDGGSMDGFPPVLDFHENIGDLNYNLLCATLELESMQSTKEEMMRKDVEIQRMEQEMKRKDAELQRKEEESNGLAQLLKITTHERDVARDELQMLLNRVVSVPLPLQSESSSQMMRQSRGSSSITESDSPSETHSNYHSFASSPIDFDSFTSPNISNIKMTDSIIRGAQHDEGSWIIDRLAMKRALPEKGKLLQAMQAVTRATPLLETLFMTGSLPEWRNPPPVLVHPVVARPNHWVRSSLNGWHPEKSMESPSLLEARIAVLAPRGCRDERLAVKRQRIQ